MKTIDVNEIDNLDKNFVIDVREMDEVKAKAIPGIKNIPMMGLMMNPDQFLNKDVTYYIMCLSGGRSSQTCMTLEDKGYNVINLAGGISSYKGNTI